MFFCGFEIKLKLKNPHRFKKQYGLFNLAVFYLIIAEQATLAPEFPAGCET